MSSPLPSLQTLPAGKSGSASPGALQRLAAGRYDAGSAKVAGREFEAMFIAQMLKPVFEGVTQGEMFGGGPGETIYRGLLMQEYGKAIAARWGIGIGDQVSREILALQEASRPSGDGA